MTSSTDAELHQSGFPDYVTKMAATQQSQAGKLSTVTSGRLGQVSVDPSLPTPTPKPDAPN